MARAFPDGSGVSRALPEGSAVARAFPDGSAVKRTFPPKAASGEPSDGFAEKVQGTTPDGSSLVAWWSPNGAAPANLSTGDVAMPLMGSSEDNPAIKVRVKDAGDWKIVEDNIGSTPSLTSAVEGNEQRRAAAPHEDNFCGIDSSKSLGTKLDEVLGGDDGVLNSGFVLFKPSANVYYQDIIIFGGNDASGQTSNYTNDTTSIRFMKWAGDSNYPSVWFGAIGSFNLITRMETSFSSKWWYIAWRMTARSGTSSTFSVYLVPLDGSSTWSDVITNSGSFDTTFRTGLTFGHESSHAADDQTGWRWGPMGLYKGDIGVGTDGTTLRTIFESIK